MAATLFLAAESALTCIIAGQNFWKTSWIIGSVFMGSVVVNWPPVFDFASISASIAAFYPTALVVTFALCEICPRVKKFSAIYAGCVLGLAAYFVEFYEVIRWFPWLLPERNGIMLTSHLVFGGLTAWLVERAGMTGGGQPIHPVQDARPAPGGKSVTG